MKKIQIKLNVQIHKVRLQVKFPCSLLAVLKIDTEEISLGKEVLLRMGEATLQYRVTHSLSVLYDSVKEVYSQKKIMILIYLKSASSLISAGAAFLNLNSLKQSATKLELNIQKCPDKDAIIEASLWFQKQSEVDCLEHQEIIKNKFISDYSMSNASMPATRNKASLRKLNQDMHSEQKIKKNQDYSDTKSYGENGKQVGSVNESLQKQPIISKLQIRNSTKRLVPQSDREPAVHSFNPISEYGGRSKNSQTDRQYKNLQKKYDQQNLQLKATINRKDGLQKALKEVESQLKIFKQKYEDTLQQNEAYLKKMEFKQNSSREQIKSLNDKLTMSEIEKQKFIFQKNDLVNSFEERERTLRLNLREKQKTFNEEKNRLQKKLDAVSRQFNDSQSFSLQNQSITKELTKEIANEKNKSQKIQMERLKLVSEVQRLKAGLLQQKSKRQQLEQSLADNAQLEDIKKKLKKKIAQQQSDIEKLTNNITTLDANSQRWQRKSQQLESLLKEKTSSLKSSQKQNQNLGKQIDNYKKTIQDRDRKIQDLSLLKQSQLSKCSNLTDQIRQLQKKYQQQLRNIRQQGRQKDSGIKALNEELQKAKLTLSAYDNKNEKLQRQILSINNQAYTLEQQIEKLSEAKSELEDKNNELSIALEEEQHQKQNIKYNYEQMLKDKQGVITTLEKQIGKLQSHIREKDSSNSQQMGDITRKIDTLQRQNEQLQQEIQETKRNLNKLTNQKSSSSKDNEELKYELKLKTNQLTFLKESVIQSNQEITEFTASNKQLSMQIQKLKRDIQLLEEESQNLNHLLKEAYSEGSNSTQKLEQYRLRNKQFLSTYLNSIKGGIINIKPEHQQKEIVQLMQTAIVNNNNFITNMKDSISLLTTQLNDVSQLNFKISQQLQDTLSNLEQTKTKFDQARQQFQEKQKQLNQHIDIMQKNIQELEQHTRLQQAESSNNESQISKKYQLQISNLKARINQLNSAEVAQIKKFQELNNKFNDAGKQSRQNLKKSEQKAKSLSVEIDKLKKQIQQNRKEIQIKVSTIEKYEEISQTLKNNLDKTKQDNLALKETMENIRKRNEKGTFREKQLEDIIQILKKKQVSFNQKITELDKTIKDKSNELVTSRQANNKLEKQKTKLTQDSENQVANISKKLQALQTRYNNETKGNSDANKQLTQEIKDLQAANADLKSKLFTISKSIEQKALNDQYLLPIRDNLDLIKVNLDEYGRVSDQFESNKNKLLKMASTKIQQFTDKQIGDKVRQISLAYQRLKFNLLGNQDLNQAQKKDVFEQIKKVQAVIDRVLRGDR